MVETPSAVFAAREIAAHPQVDVLVLGTNDLAKELRASLLPGRAPLVPHLATVLLAAREAGVLALDGVYNDVRDLEGFEAECRQAAELGFDGKTLGAPGQIEVANRVWTPDRAAVEHARRVVEAFSAAQEQGRGVVLVDGRMVEQLHVDTARRVLATARTAGGPSTLRSTSRADGRSAGRRGPARASRRTYDGGRLRDAAGPCRRTALTTAPPARPRPPSSSPPRCPR
jgi:citrate lyase subunit beta/citryl-CoA lyase